MNQLINLGFTILISILAITAIPSISYGVISDKENKNQSLIKFIFSKSFLAYIILLPIPVAFFHAIIDYVLGLVLKLFSVKHTFVAETKAWSFIVVYYFLLCFIILTVTASVYYNKLKDKNSNLE